MLASRQTSVGTRDTQLKIGTVPVKPGRLVTLYLWNSCSTMDRRKTVVWMCGVMGRAPENNYCTCIDATQEDGSYGRLINGDHCNPNCKMKMVELQDKPHLFLFALRDIKPGEEITYDYGGSDCPWRTQMLTLNAVGEEEHRPLHPKMLTPDAVGEQKGCGPPHPKMLTPDAVGEEERCPPHPKKLTPDAVGEQKGCGPPHPKILTLHAVGEEERHPPYPKMLTPDAVGQQKGCGPPHPKILTLDAVGEEERRPPYPKMLTPDAIGEQKGCCPPHPKMLSLNAVGEEEERRPPHAKVVRDLMSERECGTSCMDTWMLGVFPLKCSVLGSSRRHPPLLCSAAATS